MFRANLARHRPATLLTIRALSLSTAFVVSTIVVDVAPIAAKAATSSAIADVASRSPSPSPVVMGGLEIELSSVRAASSVGKAPAIKALGTFVVVTVHLENVTTVAKRAKLEDSFVTTPSGSRYPVSGRAMIGLNVDADETAAEVLHEVAPGFGQSYQLAFDVPKGHHELYLHLLASYPDVGEQRVFPLHI